MTNDRRKNSRRPSVPLSAEARAGRVPEPMPLDPMEQRNAARIWLEKRGRELITELESKLNLPADQLNIHEVHSIKDQCVSVLAQLVKL